MNVIVVGAGIAGLSTAWSLVKAGHSVTLLEQGATIPNPLSASGDHHRIIRRAYRASSGYGELIGEAMRPWEEMWDDLGQSHLDRRGFLSVSRWRPATRSISISKAWKRVDGLMKCSILRQQRALPVPRSRYVPLCLFFDRRRRAALPPDRGRTGPVAARQRR